MPDGVTIAPVSIPPLETRRLFLRPLELADAVAAQRLFPHWEVVRYLASHVPWPYPPDGAFTFYRDVALPAMQRGEAWHWSLRLKTAPEEMIGGISLMDGETDHRGFWLGIPWHGQGLMTEASTAATDFWFEVLGRPVLRVPKAAINVASRRISERTGMRMVKCEWRNYVCGLLETEIWEITREEWLLLRHSYRNSKR